MHRRIGFRGGVIQTGSACVNFSWLQSGASGRPRNPQRCRDAPRSYRRGCGSGGRRRRAPARHRRRILQRWSSSAGRCVAVVSGGCVLSLRRRGGSGGGGTVIKGLALAVSLFAEFRLAAEVPTRSRDIHATTDVIAGSDGSAAAVWRDTAAIWDVHKARCHRILLIIVLIQPVSDLPASLHCQHVWG